MTIQCAITYFDKESETIGYLIGSDARAGLQEKSGELRTTTLEVSIDKSFLGENFVGFVKGTIKGNGGEKGSEKCLTRLRSLNNLFNDIYGGMNYSHIPLLAERSGCGLFIAKQSNDLLELYRLSNFRNNSKTNVARILHQVKPKMYYTAKKSMAWYGPDCSSQYFVLRAGARLDAETAQKFLERVLTDTSLQQKEPDQMMPDYNQEATSIYQVSFQGISKIFRTK